MTLRSSPSLFPLCDRCGDPCYGDPASLALPQGLFKTILCEPCQEAADRAETGSPPASVSHERALIGCCVMGADPRGLRVDAADFWQPAHGLIWRALLGLAPLPVTFWRLYAGLRAVGMDQPAARRWTIDALAAFPLPLSLEAPDHAAIVRDYAERRAVIAESQRRAAWAWDTAKPLRLLSRVAA